MRRSIPSPLTAPLVGKRLEAIEQSMQKVDNSITIVHLSELNVLYDVALETVLC